MRYLVEDEPYQKVWFELQWLAWNRPGFAGPVADARAAWYAVLTDAFEQGRHELGIDVPTPVLVSLVATFNEGLIFERLSGHTAGHEAARLDRQLVGAHAMTVAGVQPIVPHEQSRACHPDQTGFVESDGARVFWERYGDGERTILLLPTWQIVHSRIWKGQIPYLARHFRVLTSIRRGTGDPTARRARKPTASARSRPLRSRFSTWQGWSGRRSSAGATRRESCSLRSTRSGSRD